MGNVALAETAKYQKCWDLDDYKKFSPGAHYADLFGKIVKPKRREKVIDFGCGAGAGGTALKDKHGLIPTFFDFRAYGDEYPGPFIEGCLWYPISRRNPRWDYGYCCDVMEHLPIQFTALAIFNMLNAVDRGLFLTICFAKDHFGRVVDEELHLTVKPFQWWRDLLREFGDVVEARDLIGEGVFYVCHAG